MKSRFFVAGTEVRLSAAAFIFAVTGCCTMNLFALDTFVLDARDEVQWISVAEPAGPAMQFAAAELARHLSMMTGMAFETAPASSAKDAAIRIETAPADATIKLDGYRITPSKEALRIQGKDSRGCLYGAYRVLYELGCRWPHPNNDHEIVPKLDGGLHWTASIVSSPAVPRRGVALILNSPDRSLTDTIDFMAKNGYNFFFIHGGEMTPRLQAELSAEMNKREMGFEFGGHLLPSLLPRTLFEEHPDYFRMEDGKRTENLNMCPSSPGGADVMAKNAQKYIDKLQGFDHPETLHLWADDLDKGGWCSGPECEGLTETDQTIKVLNEVGKRLDLGQTKLAFCAYHASIYPPENVQPADFVRLMYAPRERCFQHGLGDCAINKRYLKYADDMIKAVPNEPEVFDYWHDSIMFRHMSFPMHPSIGKDVEAYLSVNMHGIMTVGFQDLFDWSFGINSYIVGKSLWRGGYSRQDAVEYCNAIYGPAGDTMLKFFDMVHEVVGTAMHTCGYKDHTDLRVPPVQEWAATHAEQLAPLVSKAHLDAVDAALNTAAAEADGTSYAPRIKDQRYAWDYTRHEAGVIYDTLLIGARMYQFDNGGLDKAAREDTIALIERVIEGLNKGTEMLDAVPVRLRGGEGPNQSVVARSERTALYQPSLRGHSAALIDAQD